MLYNAFRNIIYFVGKLFLIKEVNGLEKIPKKGCIIASNHVSYLDPPLIGSVVSKSLNLKVHYLAKIELFKSPLSRALCNSLEAIKVDRGRKDKLWMQKANKYLKKGEMIGIFPEGSRSMDNKIKEGKTGAVRLALASKAKIVPIGINGTYNLLPVDASIPKIKKIVVINVGKPTNYDKYHGRKITKSLLRRLTNNLMKEIKKLTGITGKMQS